MKFLNYLVTISRCSDFPGLYYMVTSLHGKFLPPALKAPTNPCRSIANAGLSEAEVVAKHGYPIDRRIVAEDVIVLVFRSRFGSERFVTIVEDQVESVKHDRNLTLLKLIPIVID